MRRPIDGLFDGECDPPRDKEGGTERCDVDPSAGDKSQRNASRRQPWTRVERDTSSVKDQEGYDEQNQRETNRAENGKPERLGEEQVSECYPTHCPECAEMLEVLLQHAPTRTVSDQRANEPKALSSFWCASSLGALLNGTNQCDERPERDEAASVTSGGRSFLVSRRISTIGCRVPRGQVDSTAHMR